MCVCLFFWDGRVIFINKLLSMCYLTHLNIPPSSVDGNWGAWSNFGTCNETCGTGSQSRSRVCDNPPPSNGGDTCPGDATEYQDCNTDPCPGELWSCLVLTDHPTL